MYPVPPAPRTAVLIPGFRAHGLVRVFPEGWSEEAANFAPSAIAATATQLETLSSAVIPSLRHALIALQRPGQPRLTEAARERLWRVFRVPVFEQIIGESCRLLALECEAHDGLHILVKDAPKQLFRGNETIETAPCACGRTAPRLVSAGRVEVMRRVAAYAR